MKETEAKIPTFTLLSGPACDLRQMAAGKNRSELGPRPVGPTSRGELFGRQTYWAHTCHPSSDGGGRNIASLRPAWAT